MGPVRVLTDLGIALPALLGVQGGPGEGLPAQPRMMAIRAMTIGEVIVLIRIPSRAKVVPTL